MKVPSILCSRRCPVEVRLKSRQEGDYMDLLWAKLGDPGSVHSSKLLVPKGGLKFSKSRDREGSKRLNSVRIHGRYNREDVAMGIGRKAERPIAGFENTSQPSYHHMTALDQVQHSPLQLS